MVWMNGWIVMFVFLLMTLMEEVIPLKCFVGWGQRGLRYSNDVTWIRDCPQSDYCFEAVSFDVHQMERLVNFPWVINSFSVDSLSF